MPPKEPRRSPSQHRSQKRPSTAKPAPASRVSTTSALPPRSYYALVTPGLEPIARDELGQLGAKPQQTLARFDKRDSVVLFTTDNISATLRAGLLEDVFHVVADRPTIESPHGPQQMARAITREALERAMLAHHALRPGSRGRSYRVVTRVAGDHPFRREQVDAAFARRLDDLLARWVPATGNPALELWIHVIGERTLVGVRLSADALAQRRYKVAHLPASLKPTVARALVTLAAPSPGDIIIDPMCGAGTIVREALEAAPRATSTRIGEQRPTAIGGDIDDDAISAAGANAGRHGGIVRWDATRLPLAAGSIDIVVTNPPYGRQHEATVGLAALYRGLTREIERILVPGGRAVILTGEATALQEALPRRLRVETKVRILLRGLPTTAFVIVRA